MIIKDIEYLDNYSISLYQTCPALFLYRVELGIGKAGDSGGSTALDFGIAFHMGVEKWLEGMDPEDAVREAVKFYSPLEVMSDDKRTVGKLGELLREYFNYYEWQDRGIYKVIGVESGFRVPLGRLGCEREIVWCGRQDAILHNKMTDKIEVKDIKTSSYISGFVANPNQQFTGYIYAGNSLWDNFGGLIVDMVGVYKSKPVRLKNGEWKSGCGPADVFFRYKTDREEWELEEFKRGILRVAEDIEVSRKTGVWVKDSKGCMNYGRECDFIDICKMPPENRIEMLGSGMFEKSVWMPEPGLKKEFEEWSK